MSPIVLAMAGVLAFRAAPAPDPTAVQSERVAGASRLFEQRRFAEAAREFLALWHDTRDPSQLFNAGISSFAARHYAHAVAHLGAYLALPGLGAEDRAEAGAQRRTALAETVAVRLTVDRPTGGPLHVEALRVAAADPRPPLVFTLNAETAELALDPGTWRLRATDADLLPAEATIVVTAGATPPVRLTLRHRPVLDGPPVPLDLPVMPDMPVMPVMPDLPAPQRRRMAIAGGTIGGAVGVTGLALLAYGQVRLTRAPWRPPPNCPDIAECRREIAVAQRWRAAGTGLLGAGVGVTIGALTSTITNPRRRRAAWAAELGAGAAAAIAGIVVTEWTGHRFNEISTAPTVGLDDRDMLVHHADRHTVGALALGLGVGLVVSAGRGLLAELTHRRRLARGVVRLDLAPGRGTIVVSTRF